MLFEPTRNASLCGLGWVICFLALGWTFCITSIVAVPCRAQTTKSPAALGDATAAAQRAQRFLAARQVASSGDSARHDTPSQALARSRRIHVAMVRDRRPSAFSTNNQLNTLWQPLGPVTVASVSYGPITGRITSVAFDPNDASGNTVWIGTTGGGVWKSTNAAGPTTGVTFAPLTDNLPVFAANVGAADVPALSIGAVAVQPASTAIVLAGTGDPNDATDSYYGQGILRSADGGQTWTLADESRDGAAGVHQFAGLATAGLAFSTVTPTVAVAAMTVAALSPVTNALGTTALPGLYYTADAGLTWQMATVYDGTQLVQLPQPLGFAQNGNPATAVVWDARRQMFIAALSSHGYYSSPDGQTWHRLANQPGAGLSAANCPTGLGGLGSPNCPIARGALAVQPATGDLYAFTVDANGNDQGLWQDLCSAGSSGRCSNAAPAFATRLDNGAMEVGQGASGASTAIAQGTYDLALTAVPASSDGTLLFAGTVDLYRCSLATGAGSCSWRNTTNAGNGCNAPAQVAPAQHALAAAPVTNTGPLLLLGNDGGLWRSTDGVAQTGQACAATDATHFDNLNAAIGAGGSLAEVVGFAQHPQLADTLLAGMGENGSAATTTAAALPSWPQMSAGEGGFPQLDPSNPFNWFVTVGAGVNLALCNLGDACTEARFLSALTSGALVGATSTGQDTALLDAPTLLDPQGTATLLLGTCRIWRGPAASAAAWTPSNALSPPLDGSGVPCAAGSALVRSLAAGGPAFMVNGAATSDVLYAGMAGGADGGAALGGHVFVNRQAHLANGSTPWTDIAAAPVTNSARAFNSYGFDVSSVVVDAHDATGGTVYVTIMGFGNALAAVAHVYRSTDFGAHWADLSANLPDAPANSLVIDPNDANTVYVAMDTGVYVTRQVGTCAAANCWTPLGAGLPNAPVTQLQAGAQLPVGDGRLGLLRAATYGRGLWQTPLLTAAVPAQVALVPSPGQLNFAAQAEDTQSGAQTVTLTSTGNAPAVIASVTATGDFVYTNTCAGQTIAVGATCGVSVRFAPTATGARTGLLTVFANVPGGQIIIPLSGTGTAPPALVLTPLNLNFPGTPVNQTAPSQILTISNTGGTPATFAAPTVSGDFAIQSSTCTGSLAPQVGCSLVITFTPTTNGQRSGVLTLNGSSGAETAQLNGTGQTPPTDTLAPGTLTFAQQVIGTTSGTQQVTLTNAGDLPLTLVAARVSSGDFTASNGCGASLAPHSTCAISVAFVPSAGGSRSGVLTVSDEVRTQTVALNGSAVAPPGISMTPATLSFAATGVGQTSATQTLTLTNNGGLPLTLNGRTLSGDFAVSSTTCGATLSPGQACTLVLVFAPTTAGPRTGALVLTDDAPSGRQIANLSGMGIDFTLAANGATSAAVNDGTPATFPLILNSAAGVAGSVALTCSGAPANSVCTVSPASAALGGSVLISAVVQTGLSASAHIAQPERRNPALHGGALVLAALPVLCFGLRRRRGTFPRHLTSLIAVVALGLALTALNGCGTTRLIPGPGQGGSGDGTGSGDSDPTPTPAGTYNLIVSGTSTGITHEVALTLKVQ